MSIHTEMEQCTEIQTYTHLTALFPELSGQAGTRKVKQIWILLKQETVSGSGISWTVCKSAPRSRQITSSLSLLQAGCPSCHPTNSVKALKAKALKMERWREIQREIQAGRQAGRERERGWVESRDDVRLVQFRCRWLSA